MKSGEKIRLTIANRSGQRKEVVVPLEVSPSGFEVCAVIKDTTVELNVSAIKASVGDACWSYDGEPYGAPMLVPDRLWN